MLHYVDLKQSGHFLNSVLFFLLYDLANKPTKYCIDMTNRNVLVMTWWFLFCFTRLSSCPSPVTLLIREYGMIDKKCNKT